MKDEEFFQKLAFWDKLTKKQKDIFRTHGRFDKFAKGERISIDQDNIGAIAIRKGILCCMLLGDIDDIETETELYRFSRTEVCLLPLQLLCGREVTPLEYLVASPLDAFLLDLEATEFLLKPNCAFEKYLSRLMLKRFPILIEAICQRDYYPLKTRIINLLLSESARLHSNVLALTHDQIASKIGSARESVTRKLQELVQSELVSCSRGKITILNKEKLKKSI